MNNLNLIRGQIEEKHVLDQQIEEEKITRQTENLLEKINGIKVSELADIEQKLLILLEENENNDKALFALIKDQFYFDSEDTELIDLNRDLPQLFIFSKSEISKSPFAVVEKTYDGDYYYLKTVNSTRYKHLYDLLTYHFIHSNLPSNAHFHLYHKALSIANFCHQQFKYERKPDREVQALWKAWLTEKGEGLKEREKLDLIESVEGIHIKELSSGIKELLDKIKNESENNPFNSPSFFEYFATYPIQAKSMFMNLYGPLWGDERAKINRLKKEIEDVIKYAQTDFEKNKETEKYFSFLLHPGILKKKKKFLQFIAEKGENYKKENPSYVDILKEISDYFGYRDYYRGMVLSQTERDTIDKIGILSLSALQNQSSFMLNELFSFSNIRHPGSPSKKLYTHFENRFLSAKGIKKYEQTELISISRYPEISQCVGQALSRRVNEDKSLKNPEDALYLFKLKIPNIKVFTSKSKNYSFPGFIDYQRDHNVNKGVFILYGSDYPQLKEIKLIAKGLEDFIWYKINPQDIEQVSKYKGIYRYDLVYRGESSPYGDYA